MIEPLQHGSCEVTADGGHLKARLGWRVRLKGGLAWWACAHWWHIGLDRLPGAVWLSSQWAAGLPE